MGTWFDGMAKRSARTVVESAPPSGSTGLTRRQVIVRGAAVTGAAWTAPVLMTAFSAASATSPLACPQSQQSTCPLGLTGPAARCCPTGQSCGIILPGVNGCVLDTVAGGICSNSGIGQCDNRNTGQGPRCNGEPKPFNICGGPGAPCGPSPAENCAPGFACTGPAISGVSTKTCAPIPSL